MTLLTLQPRTEPRTLSTADQELCVELLTELLRRASESGTISSSAARSVVFTVSNLLQAQYLRSNKQEAKIRFNQLESILLTLNSLIGDGLAPGEDPDIIIAPEVALSSSVISPLLLDLLRGVDVSGVLAGGSPGEVEPSFVLPSSVLDAFPDENEVSVAVLQYRLNPFEWQGGQLQNQSVVTSLTLNGLIVDDLSKPIILYLPLPVSVDLSSLGRRLSEQEHRQLKRLHHPSSPSTQRIFHISL